MRRNFFPVRAVEPWNKLPRVVPEVVESPSLETFKTHLDMFLCNLLWVDLLWQGVGLDGLWRSLPTPYDSWGCCGIGMGRSWGGLGPWGRSITHVTLALCVCPLFLLPREKSRSWLSTGWFTMVIAVELCDAVHVYGMVPPNYCGHRPPPRRLPYHYYEPKGPDECTTYIHNERSRKGNHHRFITEKRVFASWASLYNITFSHPTWP
uniref:Uncharacterized protein n=1 Tax=Calidris pygmaea TaxID=425635 RepID=A0A8C3JGV2_9CHAR